MAAAGSEGKRPERVIARMIGPRPVQSDSRRTIDAREYRKGDGKVQVPVRNG